MYTMIIIAVSGLSVFSIIRSSVVSINVVLLIALPFLSFALHWIRCRTRHPFKYFVPNVYSERHLDQKTFVNRVINVLKMLLFITTDYLILIVTCGIMVIQLATAFINLNIKLIYAFNGIIAAIFILLCLILLFEVLLSIGIDGFRVFRFFFNEKRKFGFNLDWTRILQQLFIGRFRICDQIFLWWTFKFVYYLLALVLVCIDSSFRITPSTRSPLVKQLLSFDWRTESKDGHFWIHLLLHNEVAYSESQYGVPVKQMLNMPMQSRFYAYVSLAVSISSYVSLIGFCVFVSRLNSVLIYALGCLVHWRKRALVLSNAEPGLLLLILAYIIGLIAKPINARVYYLPFFIAEFWRSALHDAVKMVADALHGLPAHSGRNILAHCRTLAIALLLVALPHCLIYYYYASYNERSAGIMINCVVIFFVAIEAMQAILTYALLTYDAVVRPLESLDEWLLGTRFTTGAISVTISLLVTVYSLSHMADSGLEKSHLILLGIKFYCSVWLPIESAWNVYEQRCDADKIINDLATASAAELSNYSGNCAICQQELYTTGNVSNVKRTFCGHYFHTGIMSTLTTPHNTLLLLDLNLKGKE